jgi:hypothetical protein
MEQRQRSTDSVGGAAQAGGTEQEVQVTLAAHAYCPECTDGAGSVEVEKKRER